MEIIIRMITDMTQQLPVFEEYRSLFPAAYELEEPLRQLYFVYVKFCIDTVLFLESRWWSIYPLNLTTCLQRLLIRLCILQCCLGDWPSGGRARSSSRRG